MGSLLFLTPLSCFRHLSVLDKRLKYHRIKKEHNDC